MDNFNVNDWGGYAKCYDALNQLGPYQELQKMIVKQVLFDKQQTILDGACGTGNFAFWANKIRKIEGAKMVALDFSMEMLARTKEKCGNLYKDIIRADLNQKLPFEEAIFSQVVSTLTLYTVRDPKKLLLEFYRILKPGGFLILSSPLAGYENGLILKDHCRDKGPIDPWLDVHRSIDYEKKMIAKAISDNELATKLIAIANYNRRIKCDYNFYFPQEDELTYLLFDCGFNVLSSEKVYADQDLLIVAIKN